MDQDLKGQTVPPGSANTPAQPSTVLTAQPASPAQPIAQPTNQQSDKPQAENNSSSTKTIVVVLLLLFFYPIGLIFMYVWMKWPIWVKILVTLPFVLGIVGLVAMLVFGLSVGSDVLQVANDCVVQCQNVSSPDTCVEECLEQSTVFNDIDINTSSN